MSFLQSMHWQLLFETKLIAGISQELPGLEKIT
jgi:hypothetical protein